MIKANELRIGNWIMVVDEEDSPVMVTGIWDGAVKYRESGDVAGRLKPIPLTPEILEKCGFEILSTGSRDTQYYTPDNDFIVSLYISDGRITYNQRHIKYLHQLQNLYFALTGTELEINL